MGNVLQVPHIGKYGKTNRLDYLRYSCDTAIMHLFTVSWGGVKEPQHCGLLARWPWNQSKKDHHALSILTDCQDDSGLKDQQNQTFMPSNLPFIEVKDQQNHTFMLSSLLTPFGWLDGCLLQEANLVQSIFSMAAGSSLLEYDTYEYLGYTVLNRSFFERHTSQIFYTKDRQIEVNVNNIYSTWTLALELWHLNFGTCTLALELLVSETNL